MSKGPWKNKKEKSERFKTNAKSYEFSNQVLEESTLLRKKINGHIFSGFSKVRRNIKKYEILNALIYIGLRHKKEIFEELGLSKDDFKNLEI